MPVPTVKDGKWSKERERTKSGRWRRKRSDANQPRKRRTKYVAAIAVVGVLVAVLLVVYFFFPQLLPWQR